MNLSKNFTLAELTASQTAKKHKIKNEPNAEQLENLRYLVTAILQPLRDALGVPIKIASGFRSLEVNRKVGGELKSYHLCQGYYAAADITAKGVSLEAMMDQIIALDLPVEEAIIEYDQGILHIAARRPQRELLTRVKKGSKLAYSVYKKTTSRMVKKAKVSKAKKTTAAKKVKASSARRSNKKS